MPKCKYLRDTKTISTSFNSLGVEVPATNNAVECCGFESVCPKQRLKRRLGQACWAVR